MKQAFFKVLNASFISGTFVYYMLTEKYPHIVIQALTYQVQSGFKCILYSFLFQGLLLLSLYTISELLESFIPSLKSRICFLLYNTTCDVLSRPDDKPPPHLLPCRHPHLGAVLGPRHPRGPQGPRHLQEPLLPQPQHRVLPPLHAGAGPGVEVQQRHPPLQIWDRLRIDDVDPPKFRWSSNLSN